VCHHSACVTHAGFFSGCHLLVTYQLFVPNLNMSTSSRCHEVSWAGYEVADITVAAYRYLSLTDADKFLLPRISFARLAPAEGDSGYEVADITVVA
jgi:hypothetical protein